MTKEQINDLAERLKVAVIIKCIELNYIESGKYTETPPPEILAIMAESIYNGCRDMVTRDIRAWFQEVSRWKAENGRNPIVALPDLTYARAKWSHSSVTVPKGDPQLPAPKDTALASLPYAVALRDEKQRIMLTQH